MFLYHGVSGSPLYICGFVYMCFIFASLWLRLRLWICIFISSYPRLLSLRLRHTVSAPLYLRTCVSVVASASLYLRTCISVTMHPCACFFVSLRMRFCDCVFISLRLRVCILASRLWFCVSQCLRLLSLRLRLCGCISASTFQDLLLCV